MLKLACTLLDLMLNQTNKIGVYIIPVVLISFWTNKICVYNMRQIKKLTWLQTCFLGDVRVLWCNSLGDSLFQNKCFWKAFHLILKHFTHKIQCFEEFLQYFALIFKKLFFLEFWLIESVFNLSKLWLNFWFGSVCFDWCSIGSGSIKAFLIDQIYFLINRKSYREFLKHWISHVFFTIQTFFKTLSFSIQSVQGSKQVFCRFQPNFFKGFCHLRPVKPLYPSFFFYFWFSCIFVMHLGLFLNLREIGIFYVSSFFFGNWSMGFCCETI